MTLHDVSNSIFNITVDGIINGEKFSRREFVDCVDLWFRNTDKYFITAVLPDGEWLIKIYKVKNFDDMYDYDIPDTREDEQDLWFELINGGELNG